MYNLRNSSVSNHNYPRGNTVRHEYWKLCPEKFDFICTRKNVITTITVHTCTNLQVLPGVRPCGCHGMETGSWLRSQSRRISFSLRLKLSLSPMASHGLMWSWSISTSLPWLTTPLSILSTPSSSYHNPRQGASLVLYVTTLRRGHIGTGNVVWCKEVNNYYKKVPLGLKLCVYSVMILSGYS